MYLTMYKPVKSSWFTSEAWSSRKYTKIISGLDNYNPSNNIKAQINAANRYTYYWDLGLTIDDNMARCYHSFQIPKRDGTMRDIKEPVGNLKFIQKNICYKMKGELGILPHDCCNGFVKHRSCKTAMQRHQENGSMWFLKLDIHNFFPSISSGLIYETFKLIPQMASLDVDMRRYIVSLLVDETGHLTQGCVSSPYIANLVLLDFDYKFSKWCNEHDLCYTRYADDMCISSRVKFNANEVVAQATSLLPAGIHLNNEKTKMSSINGKNIFLGIHYNQGRQLTVGHETKHLMKVIAHKAELGQVPAEELPTWKGRLAYYTSIEPDYFKSSRFDSIRNS